MDKSLNKTETSSNINISTIKKIPYDIKMFSALAITGILVKIFFGNVSDELATSAIAGYSFSLFSLFGLMISGFALAYRGQMLGSIKDFLIELYKNSFPTILLSVILGILIYENIAFFDNINSGKLADEYYQFSSVSSFLVLIQIGITIYYFIDKIDAINDKQHGGIYNALATQLIYVLAILSIINLFISGLLYVILKYFSTDG
mgnify:FL=1